MRTETILGIKIDDLNYESLRNKINIDIKNNEKSTIIAINPEKIMKCQNDEKLKTCLNKSTYKIADGIGVIIASKIKKGKLKTRITGIDAMNTICQLAEDKEYTIFLYGAQKKVVSKTKVELEKLYKNIKIVGYIDGFEKDEKKIIHTINKFKPNILFVALGSPKQEFWIEKNKSILDVNIFQGVGGSFDVISGAIKRAPRFIQNIGLEWLYRLVKEPKRIVRQIKLLKFFGLIIKGKD